MNTFWQFSVAGILWGTAAICVMLSLVVWLGAGLGILVGCLIAAYLIARRLPRRARFVAISIACLFAGLPLLGVGNYRCYPVSLDDWLPAIKWPLEGGAWYVVWDVLTRLYSLAQLPIVFALTISPRSVVLLDLGRVLVLWFWSGAALLLIVASLLGPSHRREGRPRREKDSQRDRTRT